MNEIRAIDGQLEQLAGGVESRERKLELAIAICTNVIGLLGISDLQSPSEILDSTPLRLPNAERQDSWFQHHTWRRDERAAFELCDSDQLPIQAKFFWLNKKGKSCVAGSVHFTKNWEDHDFTRSEAFKVGIDFFLTPAGDSLLVVLSNRGKLRVLELSRKLRNTQIEIFNKWSALAGLKDREALHSGLWESFKLQSVNLQFYAGVSDAFTELVGSLEASGKEPEAAKLFTSRLLGRLIFTWFLRKMGLIALAPGYFETEGLSSAVFYRERLERLFFSTLNTPHGLRKPFDGILDTETPYLNGGLFSPRDGDWVGDESLSFPAQFFTRLFEHFSQFNFTTDESTPEFEQVAIDPEMLGRVFESLLATQLDESGVQARKAKGAFYTPREIVAYMCKESIRRYLLQSGIDDERLDVTVSKLLDTSDQDWAIAGSNSIRDIPEVLRTSILAKLMEIRTIDPACGSGAFPMGMLQILSKLISRLEPNQDPYTRKLQIIQNSIYGSDIEPMAVEIARLRAWLALLVDEDPKHVQPLPNLDFKFVCADSLLQLQNNVSLFYDYSLQEALSAIRESYYSAKLPEEKAILRDEYWTKIEIARDDAADERIKQIASFDPFRYESPATFFDSEEMFGLPAGFDIVIGNPPYISHESIVTPKKTLQKFSVFQPFADLYCYFFEMGYELVKQRQGVLAYITSNSFIKSEYGQPLRNYLHSNQCLTSLINVEESQLFETATVNTAITFLGKSIDEEVWAVNATYDSSANSFEDFVHSSRMKISRLTLDSKPWELVDGPVAEALRVIREGGETLRNLNAFIRLGLATGSNEAFVITAEKREELIALDPKNEEVIKPVIGGENISAYFYDSDRYLLLTPNGVDVTLDYPKLLPHFESFGEKFRNRGAKGKHWTNLRACAFIDKFREEKIVWIELARNGRFAYSDEEVYLLNSAIFMIPPFGYSAKALTGLLNSSLINFFMRQVSQTSGMGTNRWIKATVETFPIPPIRPTNQADWSRLEKLVNAILAEGASMEADAQIFREIDTIVCRLYKLSDSLAKEVGILS